MNSQTVLSRLTATNSSLAEKSWSNYQKFLRQLCMVHVGEPIFDKTYSLMRSKDFTGLIIYADFLAKQTYASAEEHFSANQLSLLIRKYPFPKSVVKIDTEKVAWEKFLTSEHKCKRVNQRFRALMKTRDPYSLELEKARDYIRYALGEFDFAKVTENCGFGPGVSIGVGGSLTSDARKFLADEWTVSPGAFEYARAAVAGDPIMFEYVLDRKEQDVGKHGRILSWNYSDFCEGFLTRASVVQHNKIAFVAKTALTDRSIAVEPLLNGFLQLGAGRYIALRLKRLGIDIEDQSRNQLFAFLGSKDDSMAGYVTIDLSSASDSVCIELCRYLLPPDWFSYLNSIRSKQFSYKGEIRTYEKFVSMGNGFCFPLETLIFSALCAACYDRSQKDRTDYGYTVYGDDIIVPKHVAPALLRKLEICGFTPNPRKTFLDGPFRESCGADWYNGVDVRPVTLDDPLDSVQQIFSLANNITFRKRNAFFGKAFDTLTNLVPPDLRFVRPYPGSLDAALEVDIDTFMASPFSRWNKNLSAWEWNEYVYESVRDPSVHRHTHYHHALLRGALKGVSPSLPFAVRRETTTDVAVICNGGGHSSWSPATWMADRHPSYRFAFAFKQAA